MKKEEAVQKIPIIEELMNIIKEYQELIPEILIEQSVPQSESELQKEYRQKVELLTQKLQDISIKEDTLAQRETSINRREELLIEKEREVNEQKRKGVFGR